MNQQVERLTEEAAKLAPLERAQLVEGILESLGATDPRLDAMSAAEAKVRLQAYGRGEIGADIDAALAEHRGSVERR